MMTSHELESLPQKARAMTDNALHDPKHPRNWSEDFSHENGNYFCRCIECKKMFIGHKRRVICKVCASGPAP